MRDHSNLQPLPCQDLDSTLLKTPRWILLALESRGWRERKISGQVFPPGEALHAALDVASYQDATGRMKVVLWADTGGRYVPTRLFAVANYGKLPAP